MAKLKKTPLWALHQEFGARMASFAGWDMPLRYDSEIAEHEATRTAACLFDVSHMAVVDVSGAAAAWLQTLVPSDVTALTAGQMAYTVLTNTQGGVIDDLVVAHLGDRLRLVLNASQTDSDLLHLRNNAAGGSIEINHRQDLAVLALQGPQAAQVLARQGIDTTALKFMHTTVPIASSKQPTSNPVAGHAAPDGLAAPTGHAAHTDSTRLADLMAANACVISRSGYTGEDGFELIVPAADAEDVARSLLADPSVTPAGLIARDSLRLEAGLCLYGNELNPQTTPVEAGLRWLIPKHRRVADGGYPGADVIARQIADGPERRLVGIVASGRRPIRQGASLYPPQDPGTENTGAENTAPQNPGTENTNTTSDAVGCVTSGGFGPSLDRPIAMAYVQADYAKPDTELVADVRGKREPCQVQRLPFVAHKYQR